MNKHTLAFVLGFIIAAGLASAQTFYGPTVKLNSMDESSFPTSPDGGNQFRGALLFGTDAGTLYTNVGGSTWRSITALAGTTDRIIADGGGAAADIVTRAGSTLPNASVNTSTTLFAVATGIGGTQVNKVTVAGNGAITSTAGATFADTVTFSQADAGYALSLVRGERLGFNGAAAPFMRGSTTTGGIETTSEFDAAKLVATSRGLVASTQAGVSAFDVTPSPGEIQCDNNSTKDGKLPCYIYDGTQHHAIGEMPSWGAQKKTFMWEPGMKISGVDSATYGCWPPRSGLIGTSGSSSANVSCFDNGTFQDAGIGVHMITHNGRDYRMTETAQVDLGYGNVDADPFTRPELLPKECAWTYVPAQLQSFVLYHGIAARPVSIAPAGTYFQYDSTSPATWKFVSRPGDGGVSAVDTGIQVVASTAYLMCVDFSGYTSSGQVLGWIQAEGDAGVAVAATTQLPPVGALMGFLHQAVQSRGDGGQVTFGLSAFSVETR